MVKCFFKGNKFGEGGRRYFTFGVPGPLQAVLVGEHYFDRVGVTGSVQCGPLHTDGSHKTGFRVARFYFPRAKNCGKSTSLTSSVLTFHLFYSSKMFFTYCTHLNCGIFLTIKKSGCIPLSSKTYSGKRLLRDKPYPNSYSLHGDLSEYMFAISRDPNVGVPNNFTFLLCFAANKNCSCGTSNIFVYYYPYLLRKTLFYAINFFSDKRFIYIDKFS